MTLIQSFTVLIGIIFVLGFFAGASLLYISLNILEQFFNKARERDKQRRERK